MKVLYGLCQNKKNIHVLEGPYMFYNVLNSSRRLHKVLCASVRIQKVPHYVPSVSMRFHGVRVSEVPEFHRGFSWVPQVL